MKISEYQIAVSIKNKYSARNDEYYWEIEMIDRDTGVLRKTYAGEDNVNFSMWQQLVNFMGENEHKAVCVKGKFRTVRGKDNIINADVTFGYVDSWDRDEFMNVVLEQFYPDMVF